MDLNYETRHGEPAICLWGISSEDKRIAIFTDYEPYFYLVPKDSQNPSDLITRLTTEKPHPAIKAATVTKKRLLGKDQLVIRVSCSDADSVEKCARQCVKALRAQGSFEEKIRPATKYQMDRQLKTCEWYEMKVEQVENQDSLEVDAVYRAKSDPERTGKTQRPPLRLLAFTLLAVGSLGSPNPDRDPVQEIAWASSQAGNTTSGHASGSEKEIISRFSEAVSKPRSDFVFSFDGRRFNWPYLIKRAETNKTQLKIGRDGGPPRQSLYGHFSITGRANVDLADFAGDPYDVKEKSLESVLRFLGINPTLAQPIDENEYYTHWSTSELRLKLERRIEANTENTMELGKDALDYIIELSSLSGLPPDQVLAAAVGFRVDNYMMMEAHKLWELIPDRNDLPVIPYRGAIVLKPAVGLHENVAVVDFSSMYPSLMVKYNISPDSITDDKDPDAFSVPEVGWRFRRQPPGLYAIVLGKLLDERKRLKQEVARLSKGSREYRLLKARERAVKIITNATYGYAGWAGSRWYSKQVAESAAALGRDTINKAIAMAKDLGLRVLYGDTDSLFVRNDKAVVERFLKKIMEELGLEISLSHVYERILFTEAMKKYAGLKLDGDVDVVGMEAIRGDWSELAKDVQNNVLRMLLEDRTPTRAVEFVSRLTRELKQASMPISQFTIWKTLTKRPGEYEVHAPHVEAAKKLLEQGWTIGPGDRVGYVIVKRQGKLYQKAEPYFNASIGDIDFDYYVDNQVVPAALRALEVFGVTEDQLRPR